MASLAFDTFAAANRFKRAGFTEDQVAALVEVTRETTALPDISTLATQADIERLEGKVDTTKAHLEARIASAQVQAMAVILSGTAVIVTLATVLSRLIR